MPRIALVLALTACGTTAAPAPTRITIRPEPAGDNCPDGGFAIDVGGDNDASGTLEPGEVESTSYDCTRDGPLPPADLIGNLTVHSAAEAQRFAGLRSVSGRLRIEGTETITMLALEEVGALACAQLTGERLELPALRRATTIFAQNCPAPALPVLAAVDELVVHSPPTGPFELPALQTVATLEVEGPSSLHAAALTSVTTRLQARTSELIDLPAVTTLPPLTVRYGQQLDAPRLRTALLTFAGHDTLTELALPELTSGSIAMTSMPALTTLALPRFASGSVSLFQLDALTTVSLPAYTGGGDLDVGFSAAVAEFDVPQLVHGGLLRLAGLPNLTRVALGNLEDCIELALEENGATSIDVTALRSASDRIVFRSNAAPAIALPALVSTDTLFVVDSPALTALSAPALTTLRVLFVQNNPQLPTCVAEELATRTGATPFIEGNGPGSCP